MRKIAIAGGGVGASALISLLRGDANVALVGVYEKNGESPGVALAAKYDIPIFASLEELVTACPDIVVNLNGDADLSKQMLEASQQKIEVIEGVGARFLWDLIEKQKKALRETKKTMADQKGLYHLTGQLASAQSLRPFVELLLARVLDMAEAPSGCVAMARGRQMDMLAAEGLSKKFIQDKAWSSLPEDVQDSIFCRKEFGEIPDTSKADRLQISALSSERIKAVLACPVLLRGDVAGILFLYDFKPRQFSDRQKASLDLAAGIIGLAIDRFALLQEGRECRDKSAAAAGAGDEALPITDMDTLKATILERTEELERVNRELRRLTQVKGRFIANTSHELRTPLNSIIGFSDVLLEQTYGALNESQKRYIKNIHTAGRHLLEQINTVLDIAKIDAGKHKLVNETFGIRGFIDEVISIMKPLAEKKLVEIIAQIDHDVDGMTADRAMLKQILYNLLSNAIKFSAEGGKAGIAVYREGKSGRPSTAKCSGADMMKFSVWDTGVGISPEDKERIFDEVEQADTTLSREQGGVGFGLALSKKLAELHEGSLSVESSLGGGSIFTLAVPFAAAADAAEPDETEATSLALPRMTEEAPLILVAEDDSAATELLTLHLSQAGYRIAHAYNGEEAIQRARTMRPFAITLDVMLPKKDGWEVLQTLKSDPRTADIPVIIHSVVENRELAFALGATAYLMKPLDKGALLTKLDELNIARGKIGLPSSILIIEEEESITTYFKELFELQGYLIYTATEGRRGIDLATTLRPSIILMDFSLSDMLSFDAIRELKENPYSRNIPIFILTERDISVEDRMTLMGKIERIVRKHAFDTKEMIGHIKELEILNPKRAGLIDELTGVFSHRYFQFRLAQEVERATRYKLPLNLVILDIDSFGIYVSNHGESHGNTALKKVSALLRKNIRSSDIVVRYGRDAFAVILPNTIISAGLSLSNRFTAIIKNYPFPQEECQPKGTITASVGIAFLDGQTPEELTLCAEQALGNAIKKGGDRVEVYSSEEHETGQSGQE